MYGGMLEALILAAAVLAVAVWLLKPVKPPRGPSRVPSRECDWRNRAGLTETLKHSAPATGRSYVVIGHGSVGLTIIEALIGRGELRVLGLDITEPTRHIKGASFKRCNVCDYVALKATLMETKADVVFLTVRALIRGCIIPAVNL